MEKKEILILNGPNLQALGQREPGVYGTGSLAELEGYVKESVPGALFTFYQSNIEGELINALYAFAKKGHGVVFNPGAFTHYAYALRDCIAAIGLPVIEVHISNVYAREEFRHTSVLAPVCAGQISGLGFAGYRLAALALLEK